MSTSPQPTIAVAAPMSPEGEMRLGPSDVWLEGLWFGLVAGAVELAVLLVNRAVLHRVVWDYLRLNRHTGWMVLVASVVAFAALGVLFALMAGRRPRMAARLALVVFVSLTTFGALLALHRIHPAACALCTLGAGARAAARKERDLWRLARFVRATLPAMALLATGWCLYEYRRVATAERRALDALPAARPGAPNLVLIVLDTVRADHLGVYGYARPTSPRFDALCGRGVRFARALTPAPWTLPAHASLFSGLWHHQIDARADRDLGGGFPLLAEFLRDRGYATGAFVANTGNCNACYGFDRGFAHYADNDENAEISARELARSTEVGRRVLHALEAVLPFPLDPPPRRKSAAMVNRDVLEWLDGKEGRPFFVFLNYLDAHGPFFLPEGVRPKFGPEHRTPEQDALLSDWSFPREGPLPEWQTTLLRDAYDDGLAYLDEQVGRLLETMDRRRLLDNTYVIVTSDHGESLGEHGLHSHGKGLFQPEVHVPLLILGPRGVPAGQDVSATVSLRDVPATVVDLLGLDGPSPFPGRSLARHWQGGRVRKTPVFSEVFLKGQVKGQGDLVPALRGPMRAVVVGSRKYIRHGDGSEWFYDLAADPDEARNLAAVEGALESIGKFRALLGIDEDDDDSRGPTVASDGRMQDAPVE